MAHRTTLLPLCVLFLLPLPAFVQSKPQVAITNVTVIDMTGRPPQEGMTVVIEGGRILKLGKNRRVKIPKTTAVDDGTGRFLVPSLWDMPVHVLNYDRMLPLFVANGVLGARDLGAQDIAEILRWRAEAAAGTIICRRIVTAGKVLDGYPQVGFFSRYRTPSYTAAQKAYFQQELDVVGEMQHSGVRIMAGTDTPNAYVIARFGLHDELAWLVTAGLTPMEALQSATRAPVEFLGELKSSGTIEKGKAETKFPPDVELGSAERVWQGHGRNS